MFGLYSKYKKPMGKKLTRHRHDLIHILKISFWLVGQKCIEESGEPECEQRVQSRSSCIVLGSNGGVGEKWMDLKSGLELE